MKVIILLLMIAPIGLFAQATLKVNPEGKTKSIIEQTDTKKPVIVETEDGKVREAYVVPLTSNQNETIAPDDNETNTVPGDNVNSTSTKPE